MRYSIVIAFTTSLLATAAWAAEVDHSKMDHSKMDHAAMGHGDVHGRTSAAEGRTPGAAAPTVTTGPWSYHGRNNPRPYTSGRWEMVPVPGYGHMFISTQGVSRDLQCAALKNPGVMVDRATRKRCGMPEVPEAVSKPMPPQISGASAAPRAHVGH